MASLRGGGGGGGSSSWDFSSFLGSCSSSETGYILKVDTMSGK